MTAPYLVLGVGNELFSDEGVGIVAARAVADLDLPGVEVVDGGTLGIALLPTVAGRAGIVILDAVVSEGRRPGEVLVLGDAEVRRGRRVLYSAHQLGVSEVLAAADLGGAGVPRVAAVGLVPFSLETGYGITPGAEARVPDLVERAVDILHGWGALTEVSRA